MSALISRLLKHFIDFIILGRSTAGSCPSVQTNTVPASCILETKLLIVESSESEECVEARDLLLARDVWVNQNNGYISMQVSVSPAVKQQKRRESDTAYGNI